MSGGLRLDSRAAILKGGDSGPAAISGKPSESRMIQAVEHRGELRMPKEKLPEAEIARLKDWVARGLPWPASASGPIGVATSDNMTDEHRRWWAFQPVRSVAPPSVRDTSWAKGEIDRGHDAHFAGHLFAETMAQSGIHGFKNFSCDCLG